MARRTIQHEATPMDNVAPLLTPATTDSGIGTGSSVAPNIMPTTIATDADTQAAATNFAKAAEMQWKVYQANNEWIRFADLKAGVLLTANGALLAVALSALKNAEGLRANPFALSLAFLSGGALLVSVGYCLWCISPKTARFHAKHDRNTDSLLFFDHIAESEKEDYRAKAKEMGSEETAYNQISQQVLGQCARIADKTPPGHIGDLGACHQHRGGAARCPCRVVPVTERELEVKWRISALFRLATLRSCSRTSKAPRA
jgi:hypothetical protein